MYPFVKKEEMYWAGGERPPHGIALRSSQSNRPRNP